MKDLLALVPYGAGRCIKEDNICNKNIKSLVKMTNIHVLVIYISLVIQYLVPLALSC